MQQTDLDSAGTLKRRVKFWEDIKDAPIRRYGPLTFSTELLDHLLDLMGEKHPIHASDSFAKTNERRQRIIPGGFIHSITSGWIVQHGSPVAILGLRSMHWDFVRPLYPDTPFSFTTETVNAMEVDERTGVTNTVRRVFDEQERTHAIGRLSVVMMRRPKSIAPEEAEGFGRNPTSIIPQTLDVRESNDGC